MADKTLPKILCVDDTTSLVSPWKSEVARVASLINVVGGFEALSKLRENADVVAVLVNLSLKHVHGIEAVRKIREKNSKLPLIVMASKEDNRLIAEVARHQIHGFVFLPVDFQDLMAKLSVFLPDVNLQSEPQVVQPVPAAPAPASSLNGGEEDLKSKYYQAQSHFLNENFDEAIECYEAIIGEKRLKDSYLKYIEESMMQLGRCWMRKKDYTRAIDAFKVFIAKAPKNLQTRQVLFYMGSAYVCMNDRSKAINFFQKVVSLNSVDSLASQARKQIKKLGGN